MHVTPSGARQGFTARTVGSYQAPGGFIMDKSLRRLRGYPGGVDVTSTTSVCPRCRSRLTGGAWEPVCLQCGYHDWSQTDDNRERFSNNGNRMVEHAEWESVRDRSEPRLPKVKERTWRWRGGSGKKRSRQTASVTVTYVLQKVGKGLVCDWPATAVAVRGIWPWSPNNGKPQHALRQAFQAETGRVLYGLRDCLVSEQR